MPIVWVCNFAIGQKALFDPVGILKDPMRCIRSDASDLIGCYQEQVGQSACDLSRAVEI